VVRDQIGVETIAIQHAPVSEHLYFCVWIFDVIDARTYLGGGQSARQHTNPL
jgi:hypothetical protein